MLKLKLQYFDYLIWRNDFLETPWTRKIEGRRKRGQKRVRRLDGIIYSMDMSCMLHGLVMDKEPWCDVVLGVTKSQIWLSDWNKLNCMDICVNFHEHSQICPWHIQFSSVQSLSHVQLVVTPRIAARQASLSIINKRSSLRITSIESVMPSRQLILYRPLLLLPSIPSSIRVFSNESTLYMRWAKYWSFSFSIIPAKEIPGLISFRMDWLDLLAVQGTLNSLLQHHSSKASVLHHSAFFTVQLSHPYMNTGKTIALTRRTFVDKVMSLLFNMLSRLVVTFLQRSKHLLISWLQSPAQWFWSPKK